MVTLGRGSHRQGDVWELRGQLPWHCSNKRHCLKQRGRQRLRLEGPSDLCMCVCCGMCVGPHTHTNIHTVTHTSHTHTYTPYTHTHTPQSYTHPTHSHTHTLMHTHPTHSYTHTLHTHTHTHTSPCHKASLGFQGSPAYELQM